MNNWKNIEKEFEELDAVNYNVYIGSGTDACDNCLEYEDAVKQILAFFKERCVPREELLKLADDLKRKMADLENRPQPPKNPLRKHV